MEKQDVHALKTLIGLLFAIGVPIAKEVKKDKFDWTDLIAFIGTEEFKLHFGKLLEEAKEIPLEVKDIDLEEGFELVGYSLIKIKDLIQSFKG